ncbi:MAG: hypothetical protein IKI23_11990 [Lachnospiraceae bacterium]|nr:hypothetical protein [Lachnospiraceae bacterium]
MKNWNMDTEAKKAAGTIPDEHDMSADECMELVNRSGRGTEAAIDAVCTAFRYGYSMGLQSAEGIPVEIFRTGMELVSGIKGMTGEQIQSMKDAFKVNPALLKVIELAAGIAEKEQAARI